MQRFKLVFYVSLLFITISYAQETGNPTNPIVEFTETDDSPSTFPYKVKVSTNTLTDNGDGTITISTGGGGATSLTGLSDVGSATITSGRMLVADGTKFQSVALSGGASITSAGSLTVNQLTSTTTTAGETLVFTGQSVTTTLTPSKALIITSPSITFGGHIRAETDNTYDIGTTGARFRNAFLRGALTVAGAGAFSGALSGTTGTFTGAISGTSGTFTGTLTTEDLVVNGLFNPVNITATGTVTGDNVGATTNLNVGGLATIDNLLPSSDNAGDIGSPTVRYAKIHAYRLSFRETVSNTKNLILSATSSTVGGFTLDRTLFFDLENSDKTIKLTGNPTLNDWFDQSVKTTGTPTFASFIITGGVTAGRILVANGTQFQSVAMSGDVTINSAGVTDIQTDKVGSIELAATGVSAGSYTFATVTVDTDGRLTFAAGGTPSLGSGATSLTGLSDVGSATITGGRLLIADGTKFQSIAMVGDITINSGGSTTIQTNAVADADLATTESINLPIYSAKLTGAFVVFTPGGGDATTQGAQIDAGDGNWRLLFDDTVDEGAMWQFVLPDYWAAHSEIKVFYSMVSATTLEVDFEAAVMCVSPGDAADIGTASFANVATASDTVPATAGFLDSVSITVTDDSCAAGDVMFVFLSTDANDATLDDAVSDREIIAVEYEFTR